MIQPNCSLKPNDFQSVVKRIEGNVVASYSYGTKAVAGQRIEKIERPHDEDLFPPPCAVLAYLVWHRGRSGVGHGVYTLGLRNAPASRRQ